MIKSITPSQFKEYDYSFMFSKRKVPMKKHKHPRAKHTLIQIKVFLNKAILTQYSAVNKLSVMTPQILRICGIKLKMLAIKNKSQPTMTGNPGRKKTDPTVNAKFPMKEQRDLKEPIFSNGLTIVNQGQRKEHTISVIISKTEPIVKRTPPALGLTFLRIGQYTIEPAIYSKPPRGGKNITTKVAIYKEMMFVFMNQSDC